MARRKFCFRFLAKFSRDYLYANGTFDEEIVRSTGRAVPFAWMEIMDDDGKILPPGETGEIVVRSTIVMQGYYKRPKETKEVSKFGWHHTSGRRCEGCARVHHDC